MSGTTAAPKTVIPPVSGDNIAPPKKILQTPTGHWLYDLVLMPWPQLLTGLLIMPLQQNLWGNFGSGSWPSW